MSKTRHALAALAAFGCVGVASALPVTYQGTLTSGLPASGSVGGTSWIDEAAADIDFWRFSGRAGDRLSIGVTRGSLDLDPAFSLYFGTTSAEQAFFLNDADWGGLVFLTFSDDEIDSPGPGADPALVSYVLPFAGDYTVAIGGFDSATSGQYAYNVSFAVQQVPEPGTTALFAAGLVGLAWLRRRVATSATP